ncbi:MAG: Hpt domain-containing protein, partial [Planctomycetota bacterium]
MSFGGFDPEILQDFLTECGELLEELEGDLVSLESSPNDLDLVNQVFRALHTIKGSASFLAMTNLVAIAHAAETALNAARNGTIVVDAPLMDLLLAAVDTVKRQFEQLQAGDEMEAPDANLVETLTAIGEGRQTTAPAAATAGGTSDAGDQTPDETAAPAGPYGASSTPLELGPSKADLFEFLVADVDDTLERIDEQLKALADEAARHAASAELGDLCEALARSVEFFEFDSMARLVTVLNDASKAVEDLESDAVNQLLPLLAAAHCLIAEQTKGLHAQAVWEWPIDTFVDQIEAVIRDGGSDATIPDNATPQDVLETQGVWSTSNAGAPAAPSAESTPATPATPVIAEAKPADGQPAGSKPEPKRAAASAIEQTIRVEVGRLESLMNLVGELVLQKNRVSAMSRKLATTGTSEEREAFAAAASELDRVTGDIQLAVMRTRMQPLEKLFGKYPRLIRDLAQKTGKKIELVIEGAETEVDKSVIEELGDPLVHVLRNSADHGVEGPDERTESGKEALGTIKLSAANEGGVVK